MSNDGQVKPLILVDGSSWLFRAYHALPPLTNNRGEPTGAAAGMTSMLRKLVRDYAPERIAVIFDPKGRTFRDDIYPDYKANRPPTPEDLSVQVPPVLEIIAGLGLPLFQVDGFEADDVIGTLTMQAVARGIPVLIVTGDKDMAQFVDERVKLLDTMKNRVLDAKAVFEKFGVTPAQIIDYLALVGDSSDNIPGVPGVGPKTAAKWLGEHGTLEAVVAAAEGVKGKVGENLRASLGILPMSKTLATIRTDVPLPLTLEDCRPKPEDPARLAPLYRRMGFTRLLEEIGDAAPPAEPEPDRPASKPTQWELVLDEAALEKMARELEGAELICFDSETDSLDPMQANLVGLAFAVRPEHGWYVPLGHEYLGAPPQLPQAMVLARVAPVLADASRKKVGQHIKYDVNVLQRHGVPVAGIAYDTMLESYVLDAANWRHDMDSMADKHLGHKTIHYEEVTGKGKNQFSFRQVDVERAAHYSAEDADITLRLHNVLYPRVAAEPKLLEVFERIEMPLVPVLAAIEQAGVQVDGKLLRASATEFGKRMLELQAEAYKEAGTEFNLGSPIQLAQVLFELKGLPVLERTGKGVPSTNEDVLERLAEEHLLPQLIMDWRSLQKLVGTYSDALPRQINPKTGRIHTTYHQAVAATGRLSSQDPNLQNIPVRTAEGRRIREAFIAPPGMAILSIDYSQIELRLMAHLSRDARLLEAFRSGQDIHRATAAEVFGLPPDQVPSEQRRAAKAINFGLIYGISAFGLGRQLSIPRREAAVYMDKFFTRYPGVKAYMDGTRAQARTAGFVETLFGRRLRLLNIRSANPSLRGAAERVAINAPLQGTAADLIKLAMIDLHAWLAQHAPAVRMIMQVHDELVFEGPAELLPGLAPTLAARMCAITQLEVPLVADWGVGPNWNSAHESAGTVTKG